eukprot:1030036-Rhodomonas_salina.2
MSYRAQCAVGVVVVPLVQPVRKLLFQTLIVPVAVVEPRILRPVPPLTRSFLLHQRIAILLQRLALLCCLSTLLHFFQHCGLLRGAHNRRKRDQACANAQRYNAQ